MASEQARQEVLKELKRKEDYYRDLVREYGTKYSGTSGGRHDDPTYFDRAEAFHEAIEILEVAKRVMES